MPSTLGYALLGLLARTPSTGYDLSRRLRQPIGYFWTATHSQVYPELAKLESAGLVRYRVVPGPGPRDTKTYRITAAGRRALATWAATPIAADAPERDEFMLKIFSLWTADPVRAIEALTVQRDRHVATLDHYRDLEAQLVASDGPKLADPTSPEFSGYATLRRGISYETQALTWCDWLLATLRGDQRVGPDAVSGVTFDASH